MKNVELCNFGSREWHAPALVHAGVVAVAMEVVAHAKLYPVMVDR